MLSDSGDGCKLSLWPVNKSQHNEIHKELRIIALRIRTTFYHWKVQSAQKSSLSCTTHLIKLTGLTWNILTYKSSNIPDIRLCMPATVSCPWDSSTKLATDSKRQHRFTLTIVASSRLRWCQRLQGQPPAAWPMPQETLGSYLALYANHSDLLAACWELCLLLKCCIVWEQLFSATGRLNYYFVGTRIDQNTEPAPNLEWIHDERKIYQGYENSLDVVILR